MAKQEVAKKDSKLPAVPSFMTGDAGMGTKGLDTSDLALPRIALLQATSDQVLSGEGKPGDYYHLLADVNLGSSLSFIPIMITKSFLLWRPRDTGGGLLARADDAIHWSPPNAEFTVKMSPSGPDIIWKTAPTVAESGLDGWGTSDPSDPQSPPAATKLMNVLLYLPDFVNLSPSIFTMQRATLKPGRKFAGKLTMSQVPPFGMKFMATAEVLQSPKGAFQSPVFTMGGFNQDEDLYNDLKGICAHYEEVGVKVSETGLDEEVSSQDEGEKEQTGPAKF